MAFQVSPGVLVQEKDLTRIIPAVSTSIGAFAGTFTKGPLDEVVSISSEQELVSTFGKPNNSNFEDFFSAANFLQYSNALRVVRVQNSSVSNATESGSAFVIKNTIDYTNMTLETTSQLMQKMLDMSRFLSLILEIDIACLPPPINLYLSRQDLPPLNMAALYVSFIFII